MRIEPETARDIRSYGPRLVETSPERVRDELVNLLNVARPAAALRVADVLGLLKLVIPEAVPQPDDGGAGWQRTLTRIEYLADILLAISPVRTGHTSASFQLGILVMQLGRYRAGLQEHLNRQRASIARCWHGCSRIYKEAVVVERADVSGSAILRSSAC
jgi:tRNA nucleotidyltransferase/poly(A) polymerase